MKIDLPTPMPWRDFLRLCSVLLGMIAGVVSESKKTVRFEDIPFQRETRVLNKSITCDESTWGTFGAPTYTCDDIRVDGLRLAYGYYPGWGVDETCQETGGRQELTHLCKQMLKSVDKHHQGVYGVYVNNATCGKTEEKRYMLVKKNRQRHKWVTIGPGNGWLSSLSCMVRS